MIIVAGYLRTGAGQRDSFIAGSLATVRAARESDGCIDFSVSPDPLDDDRVNLYEAWASPEQLEAFRASAPGEDLFALIVSAQVGQFDAEARDP